MSYWAGTSPHPPRELDVGPDGRPVPTATGLVEPVGNGDRPLTRDRGGRPRHRPRAGRARPEGLTRWRFRSRCFRPPRWPYRHSGHAGCGWIAGIPSDTPSRRPPGIVLSRGLSDQAPLHPPATRERPPYTPRFSSQPPVLAGRGDLIAEGEASLLAGPRDQGFGRLAIGDRGLGKTVRVDAIGRRMQAHRWLQADGVIRDRQHPLVDLWPVVHAKADRPGRPLRSFWGVSRRSSGPIVPATVRQTGARGVRRPTGDPLYALDSLLETVGEAEAERGGGMVITLDEVQVITPADRPSVGDTVSVVSKRRGPPVVILAAGLAIIVDRLRAPHAPFVERFGVENIGPLPRESARLALLDPAAFAHMLRVSGGFPYLVQLYGWAAWPPAAARDVPTITLIDAPRAEPWARDTDRTLVAPRWATCSIMEQRSRTDRADLADGTDTPDLTRAVAERVGTTIPAVSDVRDEVLQQYRILTAQGVGHGDHDVTSPVPRGRPPSRW